MITIEQIEASGVIPESFHNVKPGCAVFYIPESGVSTETKKLIIDLAKKCYKQYDNFTLDIKVETTTNSFLENTIVAKRLNVGSLYRYNLLLARVNCQESVDAFVKEFFNLASHDDETLKFIDMKPQRSRYDYFEESSFAPTGMLQMIVMNTREEEEDDEEDEIEMAKEQKADLDEIIQKILDYADKYKQDVPKNILCPLAGNKYVITEDTEQCKLIFEDHEFWLKAGTTVCLDLSNLQKAFYLLMLAHPEGIEPKRLSEHSKELLRYYQNVFMRPASPKTLGAVDNLVKSKEYEIDTSLLKSLCSKLNKQLNISILNRTNQLPFRVQNKNGILLVDLPRKFFECRDRHMHFEIKE